MSTEVSRAPLEEEVQPVQVPRALRDVEVVWMVSVQQSMRVPYQRAHPEYPHQAEQKNVGMVKIPICGTASVPSRARRPCTASRSATADSLPASFDSLTFLRQLNLHRFRLTMLPESFRTLMPLQQLDPCYN